MQIDPKLLEIAQHTHNNEIEILHSKTCSCLFCRQQYDARKISDWMSDEKGMSAICPECGMDAVIGDEGKEPLDKDLLKKLNLAFYGNDYMSRHPEAAEKYVTRYQEGKITHKKANEDLYIEYLSLLSMGGDEKATYDLASLYEFGDDFTKADKLTALSYYASNPLRNNPNALARIGVLLLNNENRDEKGAYECFAKGMALGGLENFLYFSDCYMYGIGTHIDQQFALEILSSLWGECHQRFTFSVGKDVNIFPPLCLRLGRAYENGLGLPKDVPTALRFYLLAEFAYEIQKNENDLNEEEVTLLKEASERIAELGEALHLLRSDPVFDSDTFADSILSYNMPADYLLKKTFHPGEFDQTDHSYYFDITYPLPQLIVDIGNLYVDFVPGTIHWSFLDVKNVQLGNEMTFDNLEGNPDEGWNFYKGSGEGKELVASITFLEESKKKNTEKEIVSRKVKGTDA